MAETQDYLQLNYYWKACNASECGVEAFVMTKTGINTEMCGLSRASILLTDRSTR